MRLQHLLLIGLIGLLGMACSRQKEPDTALRPPAEPLACTTDDDCTVTCFAFDAEDCCGELCSPCTHVMNQAAAKAHRSWRKTHCQKPDCPVASCTEPTHHTRARCEQGACILVETPR